MIVNDLPEDIFKASVCAIDTETNGLDHRRNKPLILQYASEVGEYLVPLSGDQLPVVVAGLLHDPYILKVFHHAPFDLRMLQYNYRVNTYNVACTKVLAKIIDPTKQRWKSHSLANLLDVELGVKLDKSIEIRAGDWTILNDAQIEYAMKDVRYLVELYERLYKMTDGYQARRAKCAFDYLPKQIDIDCAEFDLTAMYGY